MNNVQMIEELVRKELSQILDFHEIRNSQILSRFLVFVVEKKLSGEETEIKEYTIAVKGLGKSNDFNPQLDASVRIHAGRLRRSLAQYYRDNGKDASILIDIPKGSYVPVFISRNDHQLNKFEAPAEQQLAPTNGELHHDGFEPRKRPIVAVLPFQNLSPEHSKDYFVAGIGEQMSTDLARFTNISVISYFSTSAYNAELKDLQTMKREVNIDYVLTGSVRFINDTVKLNVYLILAENGEIIYSKTYARHLTPENIFDIQDEIISQVLNIIADDNGIISMNMAHSSPFRAEQLTTQDAIYKYFDFTRDYSLAKFQIAIKALEKAVQAEPDNALALALLAGLYMDSYIMDENENKSLLDKATGFAFLAAEMDPRCQHAQKSLAWSYLLNGKREKSFEAIEQCIKLNPKASSIIGTMALAYICQGDYVQGFKWVLESIHLNPTSPPSSKFCFMLFYFHNRDYHEANKWAERIAPLETPFMKLFCLSIEGKIYKRSKGYIDKSILLLRDKVPDIIGRMIFDEELKKEIMDGLQIAGLTVK
jgi:TolB-like protein